MTFFGAWELVSMFLPFHIQPHNIARLATLGWIGLLIYLAQLAQLPSVPIVSDGMASQLAHFGTHLMLVALVYLSIPSSTNGWHRARAVAFAFSVSVILGIGLESLQSFVPSRAFVVSDLALDTAGAATGAALVVAIGRLDVNRRLLSVAALGVTLLLIAVTGATVAFESTALAM